VNQRDFIYKQPPGGAETQADALMRLVKTANEVPGPIQILENANNEPLIVV
jgi:hypothetical protein